MNLQLLDVFYLDGRNLLDDGIHILRADLVQQACLKKKTLVRKTRVLFRIVSTGFFMSFFITNLVQNKIISRLPTLHLTLQLIDRGSLHAGAPAIFGGGQLRFLPATRCSNSRFFTAQHVLTHFVGISNIHRYNILYSIHMYIYIHNMYTAYPSQPLDWSSGLALEVHAVQGITRGLALQAHRIWRRHGASSSMARYKVDA